MANQGQGDPTYTTVFTTGDAGIHVGIRRESGVNRDYTIDLSTYTEVVNTLIDVTDQTSYSVADPMIKEIEDGDAANDYVCLIESSKPINLFTSCVIAQGNIEAVEGNAYYFNGCSLGLAYDTDTTNVRGLACVYIDVNANLNFLPSLPDYIRENNGCVNYYDPDVLSGSSAFHNIAEYIDTVEDHYSHGLEYNISFYNMFNTDFFYEIVAGVGYKIFFSKFEDDAQVRIKLYKKVSSVVFNTNEVE